MNEQLRRPLVETLNSRTPTTTQAPRKRGVALGHCRECNLNFQAIRSTAEFCCTSCRQAFHNRQARRGAAIYSLAMEWRADRCNTTALNVLCRMLAEFKKQDEITGRKSWDSAARLIRAKPYLGAARLDMNLAGVRRRK